MQLLTLNNITKHCPARDSAFKKSDGVVHAVDDVSLSIEEWETFGLVERADARNPLWAVLPQGFWNPQQER